MLVLHRAAPLSPASLEDEPHLLSLLPSAHRQPLFQIALSLHHVAASAYTTLVNTSINNFVPLVVTPLLKPFYSKPLTH